MEYSPAYLLRAIANARAAGLVVPAAAFAALVGRCALSTLRAGNLSGAVSTLTKGLDMTYVITVLKGVAVSDDPGGRTCRE